MFNTIKYIKGSELVESDILSRNCRDTRGEESKVIDIHIRRNHRNNIMEEVKNENIHISENKLKEITKNCEICQKVDRTYEKSCKFVRTVSPGEVVSMDIMDVDKRYKILVAIDYFTRYVWARCLDSKESRKVLDFIKDVHTEMKVQTLLTDSGKEFHNNSVSDFCKANKINRKLSTPYYHQSNGRVERVIRTIRTGLKKITGPIKANLGKVVDNYNKTSHRGIGMSPESAVKKENWGKVIENSEKYSKEFKGRILSSLSVGDEVYIRNETRQTKMDLEWNRVGIITEKCGENTYMVKTKDGKEIQRHKSQLKFKGGNVG